VRNYGAAGDGKVKDTAKIQRAVDECAKSGGGTVYLSPRVYLSGTIVLRANVAFFLEAGATLLGSTDLADYSSQAGPPMKGDAKTKHLLFARDAANLTVCGPRHINGQGSAFWPPVVVRRPSRKMHGAMSQLTIGNLSTGHHPCSSSLIARTSNRGRDSGERSRMDHAAD